MSVRKVLTDIKESVRGTSNYGLLESSLDGDHYPVDLDFTLQDEPYYYEPKDRNGLPLRSYSTVGDQYSPTRVAAFGLAHFNRYRMSGDSRSVDCFLAVADWFAQSPDGRWYYRFDWGALKSPWISCMAQGEAISVLCRAYALTQNALYREKAVLAAEPFSVAVAEGGVLSELNGGPFVEEYPSRNPAHTLNGFLYAMIGLMDLRKVDPEAAARANDRELLETVSRNWMLWDLGFWSAYDLRLSRTGKRNPSTVSYHRLHVTQLRYLGKKTGKSALLDAAERWESQSRNMASRIRALAMKVSYRRENPPQR